MSFYDFPLDLFLAMVAPHLILEKRDILTILLLNKRTKLFAQSHVELYLPFLKIRKEFLMSTLPSAAGTLGRFFFKLFELFEDVDPLTVVRLLTLDPPEGFRDNFRFDSSFQDFEISFRPDRFSCIIRRPLKESWTFYVDGLKLHTRAEHLNDRQELHEYILKDNSTIRGSFDRSVCQKAVLELLDGSTREFEVRSHRTCVLMLTENDERLFLKSDGTLESKTQEETRIPMLKHLMVD